MPSPHAHHLCRLVSYKALQVEEFIKSTNKTTFKVSSKIVEVELKKIVAVADIHNEELIQVLEFMKKDKLVKDMFPGQQDLP